MAASGACVLRMPSRRSRAGWLKPLSLGKTFIGGDSIALILGDNIFYGSGLATLLQSAAQLKSGATIFAYSVSDPERYGVVEFDESGKALSIEEKPMKPRSKYAVPGMYFYDNQVIDIAETLQPSSRGELEITDINLRYLEKGELSVEPLGRGVAWLDAGTHPSLLQAANFIQAVQDRQGLMVSCPEEIAYRMGYINLDQLCAHGERMSNSTYGSYILRFVQEERNSNGRAA